MRGLAKRRIQIAERLFDSYQFGSWNLEGVSHWRVAKTGEELCRSIMLSDHRRLRGGYASEKARPRGDVMRDITPRSEPDTDAGPA